MICRNHLSSIKLKFLTFILFTVTCLVVYLANISQKAFQNYDFLLREANLRILLKNYFAWNWRGGSAIESTFCSFRGPKLSS